MQRGLRPLFFYARPPIGCLIFSAGNHVSPAVFRNGPFEEVVRLKRGLNVLFAKFLELGKLFFDLIDGVDLGALSALKRFIGQFVVDELIREVDPVETYREVIDRLEILPPTLITHKIIMDGLHSVSLPGKALFKALL